MATDSPAAKIPSLDPAILRSLGIHPIRTEDELDRAIAIVDALSDKPDRLPEESDYMLVIGFLIEDYESRTMPEPRVSGTEMLRYVIAESGLTRAEIAEKTGVSVSSLAAILDARRTIGPKTRARLGAYFKVDPSLFD